MGLKGINYAKKVIYDIKYPNKHCKYLNKTKCSYEDGVYVYIFTWQQFNLPYPQVLNSVPCVTCKGSAVEIDEKKNIQAISFTLYNVLLGRFTGTKTVFYGDL